MGESGAQMSRLRVPGIEVVRNGRTIPLLPTPAVLSSRAVLWEGMALEVLQLPPGVVPDHERATDTVHLITNGPVRAALTASDGVHSGSLDPRSIMLMPRGSRHRFLAEAPIETVSVALHPELLARALDDTAPGVAAIELTPQWNLADPHVTSILLALRADLEDGSPAGRLYGESLGTAPSLYPPPSPPPSPPVGGPAPPPAASTGSRSARRSPGPSPGATAPRRCRRGRSATDCRHTDFARSWTTSPGRRSAERGTRRVPCRATH